MIRPNNQQAVMAGGNAGFIQTGIHYNSQQ